MKALMAWLKRRSLQTNLLAFVLILLPSAGLYLAAGQEPTGGVWALLGLVVAGNLLALAAN